MLRFIISFLMVSTAFAVHAERADKDAREQLSGTISEIEAVAKRQKQIEHETLQLEREMKSIQNETVSIAGDTSRKEQELSDSEGKLAILEGQRTEKAAALAARENELSALVSAMIRLRELPPEAIIAMPGKLDETLKASRALNIVTHTIEEDAESLKSQLHEIDELESKIKKNREIIADQKTTLDARRAALEAKLAERGKLQEELGGQSKFEKKRLADLNAKSRNLQDLVDALGKAEEEEEKPPEEEQNIKTSTVSKSEKRGKYREMRSFAGAEGRLHLPAAGKIVRHFGGSGEDSAFSRGITIETRENASVVAPYDGEVVYAGSFRDYGHIVIIRHSGDYHTLLSGMERLNCTPGQFLEEGEPIGSMGASRDERRLYMEIRKSSRPINPSPWLKRS